MGTTLSDPRHPDMDPWPAKLAAPATEEQVAAVKAAVEVIAAGGQKPTAALVAVVASRLLRQSHQPQQHTPVAAEHHLTQDDGWSAVAEVKMAADLPCFGQLDLGELDSSTWQTDANVGSMASSAARNRTRLFKATTGRHSLDMQASRVPVAASGSSSGKTKGRVTCQVAGCLQDLTAGRESYTGRYRVCPRHLVDPAVVLYANQPKELYRFCNQCFKFEKLAAFDGTKRGCRMSLARRRERSRLKRMATSQHLMCFPGQLLGSAQALHKTSSTDPSPAGSPRVDNTTCSGGDVGRATPALEQQPVNTAEDEKATKELPGDLLAALLEDMGMPQAINSGYHNKDGSSLLRELAAPQAFSAPLPYITAGTALGCTTSNKLPDMFAGLEPSGVLATQGCRGATAASMTPPIGTSNASAVSAMAAGAGNPSAFAANDESLQQQQQQSFVGEWLEADVVHLQPKAVEQACVTNSLAAGMQTVFSTTSLPALAAAAVAAPGLPTSASVVPCTDNRLPQMLDIGHELASASYDHSPAMVGLPRVLPVTASQQQGDNHMQPDDIMLELRELGHSHAAKLTTQRDSNWPEGAATTGPWAPGATAFLDMQQQGSSAAEMPEVAEPCGQSRSFTHSISQSSDVGQLAAAASAGLTARGARAANVPVHEAKLSRFNSVGKSVLSAMQEELAAWYNSASGANDEHSASELSSVAQVTAATTATTAVTQSLHTPTAVQDVAMSAGPVWPPQQQEEQEAAFGAWQMLQQQHSQKQQQEQQQQLMLNPALSASVDPVDDALQGHVETRRENRIAAPAGGQLADSDYGQGFPCQLGSTVLDLHTSDSAPAQLCVRPVSEQGSFSGFGQQQQQLAQHFEQEYKEAAAAAAMTATGTGTGSSLQQPRQLSSSDMVQGWNAIFDNQSQQQKQPEPLAATAPAHTDVAASSGPSASNAANEQDAEGGCQVVEAYQLERQLSAAQKTMLQLQQQLQNLYRRQQQA